MNKYQEALDYLVSDGTHKTLYSWGDEIEFETEHGEESLNLLQELVDKEIPMKPKEINVHWGFGMVGFTCDNCLGVHRAPVGYFQAKLNRCDVCGQVIDWSDEK